MAVALTETSQVSSLEPLWHSTAPRSVTAKAAAGDALGSWVAWQKHLERRKPPVAAPFAEGIEPPVLWGWPEKSQAAEIAQRIGLPAALAEELLQERSATITMRRAIELVAVGYHLPGLAAHLPPEMWWRLAELLHEVASEAQEQRVDWPCDVSDVVRHQLLAGELPLVLGGSLPEVRALRDLRGPAREALSESLLELTDGEGLPHARLLPVMGTLFACWTRAGSVGAGLRRGAWSRRADVQYQWLVRNAIRLADREGRFLLGGDGPSSTWCNELVTMALAMSGDEQDLAATRVALGSEVVPPDVKFDKRALPDASLNSDWAGVAVMSPGWRQEMDRLAIAYADEPPALELNARGRALLHGALKHSTICDGEPVEVTGEWERLCWESAKSFDYLELGVDLSRGLRLERQILFAHRDRVLYVADVLHASERAQQLVHRLQLPLARGVAWRPEIDTNDGLLTGDGILAAVLPLALPEWRSDPRGGRLTAGDGYLTLEVNAKGRAICCPVFIDLSKKRSRHERTWRQLTVGEMLEIVPRDVAVGFRAQSGDDQWLFYRSLGTPGNRTVLGQNLSGEFSAGRFRKSGKYKEWIEIDAV